MSEFLANLQVTATATEQRVCKCGCKAQVGPRANYRPGHDARHAGAVARALVTAKDQAAAKRLLDRLPSAALQKKAIDQAQIAAARLAAQATAAEAEVEAAEAQTA